MYQGVGDASETMLRYGYETDMVIAYQSLSSQWGLEMRLAQDKGNGASAIDNRQAADRISQTARDQRSLSIVLMPPYFDDKTGYSNLLQFDAEGQTRLTAIAEKQATRRAQAEEWNQKATDYTITLTVLAVCAFLFGLAAIVLGRIGYLFMGVGTLIGIGAVIAVAITVWLPVRSIPDAAIQKYAQGFGDAYYAQRLEYFSAHSLAIARCDTAMANLTQAIDLGGDYASAYRSRADAHIVKAQALLFGQGDAAQLAAELDRAAADYAHVIALGEGDKHVYWNLGYTYFLARRYQDAIDISRKALADAPDLKLALGMNIAVYMLGQGNRTLATRQLEEALLWSEQHPLASRLVLYAADHHDYRAT